MNHTWKKDLHPQKTSEPTRREVIQLNVIKIAWSLHGVHCHVCFERILNYHESCKPFLALTKVSKYVFPTCLLTNSQRRNRKKRRRTTGKKFLRIRETRIRSLLIFFETIPFYKGLEKIQDYHLYQMFSKL